MRKSKAKYDAPAEDYERASSPRSCPALGKRLSASKVLRSGKPARKDLRRASSFTTRITIAAKGRSGPEWGGADDEDETETVIPSGGVIASSRAFRCRCSCRSGVSAKRLDRARPSERFSLPAFTNEKLLLGNGLSMALSRMRLRDARSLRWHPRHRQREGSERLHQLPAPSAP